VKIRGRIFLNCTKNIELTRTHFPRTFTFAFTEKWLPLQCRRWWQSSSANSQSSEPQSSQCAMKSEQWKTYRTRFLVKAKQLNSALSFTDHLGRQHCGRKGDYLVESYDGVISIAPRQIFQDIYVPMPPTDTLPAAEPSGAGDEDRLSVGQFQMAPLNLEVIRETKFPPPVSLPRRTGPDDSSRARRKSPQPARSTRPPTHLGLM
jgi:hypothetical protein